MAEIKLNRVQPNNSYFSFNLAPKQLPFSVGPQSFKEASKVKSWRKSVVEELKMTEKNHNRDFVERP